MDSLAGAAESGRPSRSLVVEGGGLRGAFGAGVLAELARRGYGRFEQVVGVSSGAPNAVYLGTGQSDDCVRVWQDHTHGSHLISPWHLLRGKPLMDIEGLIRVLSDVVALRTSALAHTSTRCWVVVTNCRTGRAEHFVANNHNVFRLLQASMALPVAYGKAVSIADGDYVDGGIGDPIPVRFGLQLGCDQTVLVLTQPKGYRRKKSVGVAKLMGLTYPRFPAVGRALAERHRVANETLDWVDELEAQGKISVIRPAIALPATRLSTRRQDICATIELGRAAARAWIRTRSDNHRAAPLA